MFKNMSRFVNSGDYLVENKRLKFISNIFLSALSVALIILMFTELTYGGLLSVVVISVLLAFIFLCFALIRKNRIRLAFFILSITLLAGVTVVITNGQGIHDITIIAFPGILILGSAFTNRRYFIALTAMVLASVGWIAFGEMFGLYTAKIARKADPGDFVIVSTIVIFTAIAVYIITNSLNIAFSRAGTELHNRELLAEDLKKSLQEKDLLLREIHHRVKNNLSIIISLLNIQGQRAPSESQLILQQSINRIYSIALVHEMLYSKGGSSKISMKDYVADITTHIIDSLREYKNIEILNKIEFIQLPLETAIPCGIILNELITNSVKHGFNTGDEGKIEIRMTDIGLKDIELTVCDNGKGYPERPPALKADSIGMYLVEQLCCQLDGKLEHHNDRGACFSLTFPKNGKKPG